MPTFDRERLLEVSGWLADEAADFTLHLCRLQGAMGNLSSILELGVYRGKYLSLLAAAGQYTDATIVGVDAFLERIGEKVTPEAQHLVAESIAKSIQNVAPRSREPILVWAFTTEVTQSSLLSHSARGYDFISIDAGHEADDVAHDVALAESLMTDGAILAADDVYNQKIPGVMEGLCRHFHHSNCDLAPFAWSGNKLFFCKSAMHPLYLSYTNWLMNLPECPSYMSKTKITQDQNAESRFVPKLFSYTIVPFEWG
jgi:predicted O-methyltransferase YrrM